MSDKKKTAPVTPARDIPLRVGGRTLTLRLTINAMIAVQKQFSTETTPVTFTDLARRMENGDIEAVRGVFWGALLRHQPEMTLDQAGDLIDEVGGLGALNAVMKEVSGQATPADVDVEELNEGKPPLTAQTPTT